MKLKLFIECNQEQKKTLIRMLNPIFGEGLVTAWNNGIEVETITAIEIAEAANIAEQLLRP